MTENRESDARSRFSEHVQSIAFNLTLSRRMIGLLQTVRDYGFPERNTQARRDQASVVLSKPGTLVCELLVEAGLMPNAKSDAKKQGRAA
jgi:hypothetical protein